MARGGFRLEKSWRAAGVGTFTSNAPGNRVMPYGKYEMYVEGRGGTGTAASPGNVSGYNPGEGGYVAGYNPGEGGDVAGYNPPVYGNGYFTWVPGLNDPSFGNQQLNFNPDTPGNAYYNPYYPGNANYNPYVPAVAGAPATIMGVTFPGSNVGGTSAPYTPPVKISSYGYPAGATSPITVPSGGYVTLKSY